jgi:hypothetical protein
MAPRLPHPLFDRIIEIYKFKNDAALARALKMPPANLSRYRARATAQSARTSSCAFTTRQVGQSKQSRSCANEQS